jgi:hypothetical protein
MTAESFAWAQKRIVTRRSEWTISERRSQGQCWLNCKSDNQSLSTQRSLNLEKEVIPLLQYMPRVTQKSFRQTFHLSKTAKTECCVTMYQNRRRVPTLELVQSPLINNFRQLRVWFPDRTQVRHPCMRTPSGPPGRCTRPAGCTSCVSVVTPTTWNSRACTRGWNPHAGTNTAPLAPIHPPWSGYQRGTASVGEGLRDLLACPSYLGPFTAILTHPLR